MSDFNETKKKRKKEKKYAYINYFQSCTVVLLQNHEALQYTSANAALDFNPLAPELFFLISAHSVYKMGIIQELNKLAL